MTIVTSKQTHYCRSCRKWLPIKVFESLQRGSDKLVYSCDLCREKREAKALSSSDGLNLFGEYVYFIQVIPDGPIKIGYTLDVPQRLTALQIASPYELKLIAVKRGTQALETALHQRFLMSRLRGEWFEPSESLMAYISAETTPVT